MFHVTSAGLVRHPCWLSHGPRDSLSWALFVSQALVQSCSMQSLPQLSSGLCAEAGRAHAAARLARGLSQFLASSALSLMDNGTTDDACRAEARRIFRQYVLACRALVLCL